MVQEREDASQPFPLMPDHSGSQPVHRLYQPGNVLPRNVVIATILIAMASVCVAVSLPVPDNFVEAQQNFRFPLIGIFVTSILYAGAAVLFLSGLRDFSSKFKHAYRVLCIGILLTGFAQAQPAIAYATGYIASAYVTYGFINLPFLAATLMLLFGMVSFGRLSSIKDNPWISYRRILPVAITVALLAIVLPHNPNGAPEAIFRVGAVLNLLIVILLLFAARVAHLIKKTSGIMYASAMNWLLLTFLMQAVAIGHVFVLLLIGFDSWYAEHGLLVPPFVATALLYIRSAYAFNQISSPAKRLKDLRSITSFDIITYVAGLASDTRTIDPFLYPMRVITTHLSPGEPLSPADQEQLKQVYLQLESYLSQSDPVRIIPAPQLRQKLHDRFGLDEDFATDTFWPSLEPRTIPKTINPAA